MNKGDQETNVNFDVDDGGAEAVISDRSSSVLLAHGSWSALCTGYIRGRDKMFPPQRFASRPATIDPDDAIRSTDDDAAASRLSVFSHPLLFPPSLPRIPARGNTIY